MYALELAPETHTNKLADRRQWWVKPLTRRTPQSICQSFGYGAILLSLEYFLVVVSKKKHLWIAGYFDWFEKTSSFCSIRAIYSDNNDVPTPPFKTNSMARHGLQLYIIYQSRGITKNPLELRCLSGSTNNPSAARASTKHAFKHYMHYIYASELSYNWMLMLLARHSIDSTLLYDGRSVSARRHSPAAHIHE